VRGIVELKGFRGLEAKFRNWWTAAEDKVVEDELLKVAEMMQSRARSRVPVLTGDLQKSIVAKRYGKKRKGNPAVFLAIDRKVLDADMDGKSARAQIFWRQYAMERGNRRVPAQPYFRPAVDAYRGKMSKLVARGVRKANRRRARKDI